MGRPKTYDQAAGVALVDAAEALADAGGPGAVSVRAVAERSGTTTRAVYSVFGSKAGLVAALGVRMFELLGEGVAARPGLFEIGVANLTLDQAIVAEFVPAAREAWQILENRFQRLKDAGGLPDRTVVAASRQFYALCEGLVTMERRGVLTPETAEGEWRDALSTLLVGMAMPPTPR